jgi:hypothetical protein
MLAGHLRQVFPDRDRAREGHKPHHGLRDQIFGDFRVRYRIPGSRRPAGIPASAKARTNCTAPAGVSSEAFSIIAQPEDRAPATLRARRTHLEIPRRERRDDADRLAQHGGGSHAVPYHSTLIGRVDHRCAVGALQPPATKRRRSGYWRMWGSRRRMR